MSTKFRWHLYWWLLPSARAAGSGPPADHAHCAPAPRPVAHRQGAAGVALHTSVLQYWRRWTFIISIFIDYWKVICRPRTGRGCCWCPRRRAAPGRASRGCGGRDCRGTRCPRTPGQTRWGSSPWVRSCCFNKIMTVSKIIIDDAFISTISLIIYHKYFSCDL